MVVDNGNVLGRKYGYIALFILAIHGDKKLGRVDACYMLTSDLQVFVHQNEIAFRYGIRSAVDKSRGHTLLLQIPTQRESARKRVSIGIVVALDDNLPVSA
jgi:hypothetical protein